MKQLSLNGAWTLEIPGTAFGPVPAKVPGSVYHDLLCAGKIPDPFYRDNENEALKLMEHDFVYTRRFCADADLLGCGTVLLRCEGLDTLAGIFLNGSPVGRADNMHRTWEYDVKPLLREGENIPALVDLGVFTPDFKVVRAKYDKYKQINRFIELIELNQ